MREITENSVFLKKETFRKYFTPPPPAFVMKHKDMEKRTEDMSP